MSFDVFDMLNEATKEADAFEHHPLKDSTLEQKLLYLQGLALVMNADADIHSEEKEYLRILIKSFGLPQEQLDDLEDFAKAPDKDTIQAFFREYRRKPVAQLFLFDALMMTRRDGKVDDKEQAVVNKMAEQLEILKGTQKDIFDLFCFIKNKNWPETALYFKSHLLSTTHFQHLLDYHELTEADLNLDILKTRLEERLLADATQDIQWGEFSTAQCRQGEYKKITTRPIKLSDVITYETMLPWLQRKLERQQIRITHGVVHLCEESEDRVLFELQSTPYLYDAEQNILHLNSKTITTTSDPIETPQQTTDKEVTPKTFCELVEVFLKDLDLELASWYKIVGAREVALGDSANYFRVTCDDNVALAITSDRYDFVDRSNASAVLSISDNVVRIGFDDGYYSEEQIPLFEMLLEHGFYLVK